MAQPNSSGSGSAPFNTVVPSMSSGPHNVFPPPPPPFYYGPNYIPPPVYNVPLYTGPNHNPITPHFGAHVQAQTQKNFNTRRQGNQKALQQAVTRGLCRRIPIPGQAPSQTQVPVSDPSPVAVAYSTSKPIQKKRISKTQLTGPLFHRPSR
jgi:hypothetical protein